MTDILIRAFRDGDRADVIRCVIELQEFERAIDPRLRPGAAMADDYWAHIVARCDEAAGRVFVADDGGAVIGFVAILSAQPFTDLDDPPGTYGLVTDLVVLPSHRGQGLGRRLLEHAEAFAWSAGASELRVGVLAANGTARRLYLASRFVPHLEVLAKRRPS